MNKRANLYLNIFELLSLVIMVCFMEAYLYFRNIFILLKGGLFLIVIISSMIFISIELFLFLLLNKKGKAFYILYMLIDLIVSVYLTIKIPYAGFVILLLFATIKNALRIALVNELYMPKEFDRYCKMFGITIRDFKKTKKRVKKKEVIEIPKEVVEKPTTKTKKKTTKKKATQKEATI